MKSVGGSLDRSEAVLRRYRAIGLWGGLFLGAVAGVIVTGQRWVEWTPLRSSWVVLASTILGAVIGYFALSVAAGMHGAGPAACPTESGGSGGTGASGDSSGGADDGGGGGDS
jgi:hypothetical protein